MRTGIIYLFVSPNGKYYIGQTMRERQRLAEHRRDTIKTNTHFGKALKKYGFENFEYWVLFRFTTEKVDKLKKVLDWLEKKCIAFYMSNIKEFGYNITKGGDGTFGLKHSKETKEYIGECTKNSWKNNREKMSRSSFKKGYTQSEETKLLKREKAKGKKKVIQYDLENNVISEFDSIADAARFINTNESTIKSDSNKISECCSEKRKTHKGFIWKFK